MTSVLLRFFSGPQNGTAIELTDGTWVFGRDDSCDIILADDTLAPRHAVFTVAGEEVSVSPLDGTVKGLDGASVDGILPAGTAAFLGSSRFAWGPKSADEAFWNRVLQIVPTTGEAALSKPAESTEPTAPAPVPTPREETATPTSVTSVTPAAHPNLRRTGLVAAALIVAAVVAFCLIRYPISAPTSQETPTLTDKALLRLTKNAGFKNVRPALEGNFVRFQGSVRDDAERGRLVKFARLLPYTSSLQVTVDSDNTDPVTVAFNLQNYWPKVTLIRRETPIELSVAGYMLNPAAEEEAFEKTRANLADPGVILRRHILHRDDVAKYLSTALKQAGATEAKVQYFPGRVRVSAVLTAERRERLDKALAIFDKNCPVPVPVDLVNTETAPSSDKGVAVAAEPVDPMQPRFRVTGVSGGTLKFVKLASGEKIFTGGLLPGGFVLESVNYDRLVLTKNHQRILYPLKVK